MRGWDGEKLPMLYELRVTTGYYDPLPDMKFMEGFISGYLHAIRRRIRGKVFFKYMEPSGEQEWKNYYFGFTHRADSEVLRLAFGARGDKDYVRVVEEKLPAPRHAKLFIEIKITNPPKSNPARSKSRKRAGKEVGS